MFTSMFTSIYMNYTFIRIYKSNIINNKLSLAYIFQNKDGITQENSALHADCKFIGDKYLWKSKCV